MLFVKKFFLLYPSCLSLLKAGQTCPDELIAKRLKRKDRYFNVYGQDFAQNVFAKQKK